MRALLSAPLVLLCACAEPAGTSAAPTVVSAPTFARPAEPPASVAPAVAKVEAPEPSAEPVASAAPAASAAEEDDAPPAELPNVEVKNVGLHIGGGPNDDKTKEPIRKAIAPHFDALRACYAKEKDPQKELTFGVDILIPREGGAAKISSPRSGFAEEASACMVEVFERVEFEKPRQPMRLSYSVRFRR